MKLTIIIIRFREIDASRRGQVDNIFCLPRVSASSLLSTVEANSDWK